MMNKEVMDMVMTIMLVDKLGGKVTFSMEDGKKALDMLFKEGRIVDSNIDSKGNFELKICDKKESSILNMLDEILKEKEQEEKELEEIYNESKNISSAKEAKELLERLNNLTEKHICIEDTDDETMSLKEKLQKEDDEYEVKEVKYSEANFKLSVIIAYLLKKLKVNKISIPKEELDNIAKTVVGVSIKTNEDGMGVEIHE